jgi:putative peptide zinc metalloprotease protein
MPIERPTFHESWYRVADLHPRLRTNVQVSRQHFRGMPWHVVQDHTNNAFFRLAEPAYRFVALLDGKRSVADAWRLTNDQLGDEAPTQGEVIQLLGQLYTANLLQAEVTPDTHTLFARYKKRKQREITGYLMNIMFARVPILDPDAWLNRWLPLFGWIFSPLGLVVWAILIFFGFRSIAEVPHWQDKLMNSAGGLLSPENLILLYVGFALIKACHEMGHAIACKKFGKQAGTGGEVHVIGIMFLIFTPVPYVDASSSWALTNKWHRAIVGAAGMWVELAIASIAAMVWANTNDAQWQHAFAYNIMFVASFSTIVFNANPLLRYDGYYILSDLLEIPNLAQRGKDYIYYLVKKYIWNVRFARNPAHSPGERFWLFIYAIASFIMRMVVSFSILFYLTTVLNGVLIILATAMAFAAIITWVLIPLGKFLHYLITSQELGRVRGRAIVTTAIFTALIVGGVGLIKAPDHVRAQGVVEPEPSSMAELFPGGDGLVESIGVKLDPASAHGSVRDSQSALLANLAFPIVQKDTTLVRARNPELETKRETIENQIRGMEIDYNMALADTERTGASQAKAQAIAARLAAKRKELATVEELIGLLDVKIPFDGVLIAPELEDKQFGFVKRQKRVGIVADLRQLIIRAAVANDYAAQLGTEARPRVEIRVKGRPDILLTGTVYRSDNAGRNELPAPSLGFQMEGDFTTVADDKGGTKTVENFFEVRVADLQLVSAPKDLEDAFNKTGEIPLLPGQRVVVRFDLDPKPLAAQAWTKLQQLFQKKFQL